MYLLSVEDGLGLVSLERPHGEATQAVNGAADPTDPKTPAHAVPITYHLENRMNIGGFKTVTGWIEGEPSMLQSLLPAAEVYLIVKSGQVIQIEVTDVSGNRANIRRPRALHDN